MDDMQELIDRYIAVWNEADPARRRALIARTWAAGARYLDPLMAGDGREGIDAMIAGVQQRFPGLRFSLIGAPDGHNDRIRFRWALGPAGGEAVVEGTDFATVASDGLLASVTGFIDRAPAA